MLLDANLIDYQRRATGGVLNRLNLQCSWAYYIYILRLTKFLSGIRSTQKLFFQWRIAENTLTGSDNSLFR